MKKEKKLVVYPAIFEPDEGDKNIYTITFPDVPDAISQGKGMEESLLNATEVLELALYDVNELPEASHIKESDLPDDGSKVVYLSIDLNKAGEGITIPTVRKNTRIPAELALEAEKAGYNFSKVLTEALRDKLKK